MSLTFNRAPPLAPSAHHLNLSIAPHALAAFGGNSPRSPPLSPLNSSPPPSATLSSSQPTSPVTFPAGPPLRGTRAVPAPQLFGPGLTREMQTPFNTPASPRRAAPIMSAHPRSSISGMTSPGGMNAGTVPSSLSTPLGSGVRPLNTVSAMRGRGIGIGAAPGVGGAATRSVGIPNGAGKAGEVVHANTPENTPSSMERISKRMASNLMLGNHTGGVGGVNKIVPSYDGRFRAGLSDLGNRLDEHVQSGLRSPPHTISPSMGQGRAPFLGASVKAEWPTNFGEASEGEEAQNGKKIS